MTRQKPTKPELVMVLTIFSASQIEGNKRDLFVIFRNTGRKQKRLSLWNTRTQDGEEPIEAAARCLNSQLWDSEKHFELHHSFFVPAGQFVNGHGRKIHTFFLPWHMPPALRRENAPAEVVPVDFVGEHARAISQPSLAALHQLPKRVLKLSMPEASHVLHA